MHHLNAQFLQRGEGKVSLAELAQVGARFRLHMPAV